MKKFRLGISTLFLGLTMLFTYNCNVDLSTLFGGDSSNGSMPGGSGYCGDMMCNNGETSSSCMSDCGSQTFCGNYICEAGETSTGCSVDCVAILTSIDIVPVTAGVTGGTVVVGQSFSYKAVGHYDNATVMDPLPGVVWSTDGYYASVDVNGNVTGNNTGMTTLNAAKDGITGSISLNVVNPPVPQMTGITCTTTDTPTGALWLSGSTFSCTITSDVNMAYASVDFLDISTSPYTSRGYNSSYPNPYTTNTIISTILNSSTTTINVVYPKITICADSGQTNCNIYEYNYNSNYSRLNFGITLIQIPWF